VRKKIFSNEYDLVDLYRSGFPDPEIEMGLIDKLYKYADDDAQPRRRYIAEALRDLGSLEAIPTLEAILYDQVDTVAAKRAISQAVDAVNPDSMQSIMVNVEFESRRQFVQLVLDTIAAIKQRGNTLVPAPAQHERTKLEDIRSQPDVKNAVFELERARKQLGENDPISAVVSLRRGAEALGKHLYRYLGMEANSKPAKKMMFKDLMKPVKDSEVPDVFKLCFEALQLFGNFTTHDQDDEHLYFNLRIAGAILVLYEEALDIYGSWIAAEDVTAND